MTKEIILILIYLVSYTFSLTSGAAIYKRVDEDGHITYSNMKIKGAKKLNIKTSNTHSAVIVHKKSKPAAKKTLAHFPKTPKNVQQKK